MTGEELYVFALQAGFQYLIPAAILLRALYFGARGKLPEGIRDLALGAFVAGLGALMDGDAEDVGEALIEVIGNALFVGALFFFILIYLLKLPNLGPWVDGIIGGIVGFISWIIWVYVFGNAWPVWTGPLAASGGALSFILLRSFIRRAAVLKRWAGCLVQIGLVAGIGGFLLWLASTVL